MNRKKEITKKEKNTAMQTEKKSSGKKFAEKKWKESKESIVESQASLKEKEPLQTSPAGKGEAAEKKDPQNPEYGERFYRHFEELKWLYAELYGDNTPYFSELCENLYTWYQNRSPKLKERDRIREKNPDWYRSNDLIGMMMYVDSFAGNLKGVSEKLDYVEECHVNYLHLMPFLKTTPGRSDGGYAVADFRQVDERFGTMEDLEALTQQCHERNINVCMDFVMNHTSEDHEWARRARGGEWDYQNRYYFYDNYDVPSQFEKTVPQVFPTTAPGNFTWLDDIKKFVMTSFYPYQWDLNYWNPIVLNEMIYNLLNLANKGIDIIRIDAVPYIWKQLGTDCRNLPQVHTIVRMVRMICEIVCPGVLLLGEVVMEPAKVVPYFGTVEKPECHMLYNVTTMATTWHTVATGDTRLLKHQMDIVNALPKQYVFLNYLRCHDDIGWGLDYDWLKQYGVEEYYHKIFLNSFFTGHYNYDTSFGRGELYNADPVSGDARLCGTTASLCGIEKAVFEGDKIAEQRGVRCDLMLHAYMLFQSGIPVLYSGDEVGQLNDYSYHQDEHKWDDSRYLHRGAFRWDLLKYHKEPGTYQYEIFQELSKMEAQRAAYPVFGTKSAMWSIDTWDDAILAVIKADGEDKVIGIFNFSGEDRVAWINEEDGLYRDLISGVEMAAKGVQIPAYGYYWLMRVEQKEEAEG